MKIENVQIANRITFCEVRFQNFEKRKKDFLKAGYILTKENMHFNVAIPGQKPFGQFVDLEHHCEEINAPYRELVQCDMCNENIVEEEFVFPQGDRVYHRSCFCDFLDGGNEEARAKTYKVDETKFAGLGNVLPFKKQEE